jgi:hypothetical protein
MFTCTNAAENGHLEFLKLARAKGCPWDNLAFTFAAANGHVEILNFLFEEGCDSSLQGFFEAAKKVNAAPLLWADEFGFELPVFEVAAGGLMHPDIISWARKKETVPDGVLLLSEVFYGDSESRNSVIAKALKDPDFSDFHFGAAILGNLELLKIVEDQSEWRVEKFTTVAARAGQLHILKWAIEKGCPWDPKIIESAAEYGSVEILKFLRELGCPWREEAIYVAANRGNLEFVKYSMEHGCPFKEINLVESAIDKDTFQNEAILPGTDFRKKFRVIKFLYRKYPEIFATESIFRKASECPFVALADLMLRNSPELRAFFPWSMRSISDLHMYTWLSKNYPEYMKQSEFSPEDNFVNLADSAITHNSFELLSWVMKGKQEPEKFKVYDTLMDPRIKNLALRLNKEVISTVKIAGAIQYS